MMRLYEISCTHMYAGLHQSGIKHQHRDSGTCCAGDYLLTCALQQVHAAPAVGPEPVAERPLLRCIEILHGDEDPLLHGQIRQMSLCLFLHPRKYRDKSSANTLINAHRTITHENNLLLVLDSNLPSLPWR